jgi:O-antigen ligase
MLQAGAGTRPSGATGTYQNHNHFAGLLEMCLPFSAMFAWAQFLRPATLAASAWLAVSAALLAAVTVSLSRMGFVASLAGLFASAAAILLTETPERSNRRWLAVAATAGFVALLALLLPSITFIQRFGAAVAPGDISSDARFGIWRDTVHLIAAFPLFGCGFGAFQSAYMRYQTVSPLTTVNFAHNDYLQLLAELGPAGFLALLGTGFLMIRALLRNLRQRADPYLYAACLGAFVAISLHSLVDFNLYKPANAMVVAWIAGLATVRTLPPGPNPRNRAKIEVGP